MGVFGTTADNGAIKKAIKAISLRDVRIRSDAIKDRNLSREPLLNKAADTGKRPIRVISAGLLNPASASCGERTPVVISRPKLSIPVSSGAKAPEMNSTMATIRTAMVINA